MNSKIHETPEVAVGDFQADNSSDINRLKTLTEQFRSSLPHWLDTDGKPKFVEIEGLAEPLLHANASALRTYASEYTRIWTEQSDMMKEEMRCGWVIDCRGLYIDEPFFGSSKYRDWAPVRFDHFVINVINLFHRQIFLGFANFMEAKFIGYADFEESEFRGSTTFDRASFSRDINFSHVKFFEPASFQRVDNILGSVDFSNAYFRRAPLFHESKLPQGTSFDEATFDVSRESLSQRDISEDARAFRTLKQVAASYKGQQDEADFFALEQRARRIALLAPHLVWYRKSWEKRKRGIRDLLKIQTWRERKNWSIRWSPVEWFISLAYDWISGYGRYPDRALGCLATVNLAAAFLYQYAFTLGDCLSTADYCVSKTASTTFTHQNPAIYFALQNILSPSALVSEKALVIAHNPFMTLLAIVQFASSYIILVLAALAIRARFQKGGGDK